MYSDRNECTPLTNTAPMNAEFTGKTESLYHFGVFEIIDLLTPILQYYKYIWKMRLYNFFNIVL